MRIALCQINNTVGDLAGNSTLIQRFARQAAEAGAELAVFPELALTGYPPRDLVEKPSFLERTANALTELVESTRDLPLGLIVGYVGRAPAGSARRATNSAALIEGGRVVFRQTKMLLPTYDVFDEWRNFQPAEKQEIVDFRGTRIALTICEDAWNDKQFWERPLYKNDPVEALVRQGAQIVISINGSPYDMAKRAVRRQMFSAMALRYGLPHVYVNMVGGNDQLVFDGSSFAMDAAGGVISSLKSFEEDMVLFDSAECTGELHDTHDTETAAVYDALVLGTRDYLRKCGFKRVLLGLSGGIDSTLVACVAADAVGKENVVGVGMPGPYSSDHSVSDARSLAENLGIRFEMAPIKSAYDEVLRSLDPIFQGARRDVTEENVQARLRGLTLMALSNKWGALVLTTGNKSEIAVGYCTLYGDMCGGLAVISDVPKTMVYELCREVNRRKGPVIPENVFTKPPSAELRPDQKDSDSLPEYDVLDRILKAYVEELKPPALISSEQNVPMELVRDIVNKVDRNEYKRQQAAPGLKVTSKAFGIGRRFPIAQRFFE
ncbi:NAD+ synthase [uncultured Paludibaculum sp.]|uniref:NAD+ synthase n=1 Tax=uncultured Paludibaculum sp. TaxID=1765020 RepID=UPI002AAB0E36|nr:NAD+ synthase [uncultured Paludibaculum sp.]